MFRRHTETQRPLFWRRMRFNGVREVKSSRVVLSPFKWEFGHV